MSWHSVSPWPRGRGRRLALAAAVLAAPLLLAAGATKGVANAALAQAARKTPVKAIDYDEDRCDPRTVEAWLKDLAGANASRIDWTGGPCRIVGPGIDSGSRWCAQASVRLAKPLSRGDRPMVEIFFEAPKGGRPGPAYAFRGLMQASDGLDMTRFRKDFEADWTSRFPAPEGAIIGCEAETEDAP